MTRKLTPLLFNARFVASKSATANRAAQKRGEPSTAKPGSRRAISSGLSTANPIAGPANRQSPGRQLGCGFRHALKEGTVRRRLRRRHHHLNHAQGAVGVVLIVWFPEQFRRMTLLAGEESNSGHGGVGGEGERKLNPGCPSGRQHRVTAEVERCVSAHAICREVGGIGMRVGAVPGQHRHPFGGSQKILVVSSEAETARCGGRYGGSVGDGQQLQEVVPEHGQVVAGSERMDADRREGKAEGSQVLLSLRKIADANDEVIDTTGHGISGW